MPWMVLSAHANSVATEPSHWVTGCDAFLTGFCPPGPCEESLLRGLSAWSTRLPRLVPPATAVAGRSGYARAARRPRASTALPKAPLARDRGRCYPASHGGALHRWPRRGRLSGAGADLALVAEAHMRALRRGRRDRTSLSPPEMRLHACVLVPEDDDELRQEGCL